MEGRLLCLLLLLCPHIGSCASADKRTGCLRVNPCKCILKDGSGVINLAALGDSAGFLQRGAPVAAVAAAGPGAPAGAAVLLSFSPCVPFSEPAELSAAQCLGVAACVEVRQHTGSGLVSYYLNYGRHEGNEFNYNNHSQTLSVTYPARPPQPQYTVAHYHCSPNRSVSVSQPLELDGALEISVHSPCACPNTCSLEDVGPGTIFLIIFCLAGTAYFILGSCALRPIRTASGVQIVPEESLWCQLCSLFTVKKGRRHRRRRSKHEEPL
ncbi:uncharacterized protein LOC136758191 [Amia ocellicauda]|uniref:uncharacterized protein LOC136758191 n=1 Tax=Amia ocellicauda TaxID=2972642 RepID=UPI003464E805